MITYHERRDRYPNCLGSLYRIRSWYLFGFLLLYRRYELLTVPEKYALPSER
jgi:hypothetical protein